MSSPDPLNASREGRPQGAPPALAAFLRGVERRGAVLAELQCGDADAGDAALAQAMRRFRAEAAGQPMSQWPRRFWTLLLSQPGLRRHHGVAVELEAGDQLARLGSGPRAALLLRLAAGLDEPEAAAVLDVAPATYRLAMQRALPRQADGRADPGAWQRLREHIHRRIKTLPPVRLARLGHAREAAVAAAPGDAAPPIPAPGVAGRPAPRGVLTVLRGLLALAALLFAATFLWPERFGGAEPGTVSQLADQGPASRYGADAALVSHRDFELLADPEGLQDARELAFHSWLAAQGANTPLPGAEPGPVREDGPTAPPEDGLQGGVDGAGAAAGMVEVPLGETANEPG